MPDKKDEPLISDKVLESFVEIMTTNYMAREQYPDAVQAGLMERLIAEIAESRKTFNRIADALEEANDIEKAKGQISKPTTLKSLGKGKG